MFIILRGLAVFFFLLVVFRISGKRTLAQITTFDLVLLLIISEVVQQAMLGDDFSMTNGILLVLTLVGADIGLSLVKQHSRPIERWVEGLPVVIVEDGRPIKERMDLARVDEDDILSRARELQGLERMDQIKYAVLERSGGITIIPRQDAR
ncbi:MAG: DUF421 domain-containing protein [Chloroflexota bacterium]